MMANLKILVKFETNSQTEYFHILCKKESGENLKKNNIGMTTDGGVLPPLCNFQSYFMISRA